MSIEFENQEQSQQYQPQATSKELELGLQLLNVGKFEEAKKHLLIYSQIDPYEWKTYWALFKCELKVKDDDDIYFPGFLKLIKQSDMGMEVPLYVEYYKIARKKAYIVRTPEINFDYIELKYQKADMVQNNYNELYKKTKSAYENMILEDIPSDAGKKVVKQYAIANENLDAAFSKNVDRKYGIRFLIFAIGTILLGISAILGFEYIKSGDYENGEKVMSVLLTISGVFMILGSMGIVWKLIPIPNDFVLFVMIKIIIFISVWGTALSALGDIILSMEIDSLDDIMLVRDEMMPVAFAFIGIGLVSLLIWAAYIARAIYWVKRENDSFDECERLKLELISVMKNDLMELAFLPETDYYHIRFNDDYSFNPSNYTDAIYNFNNI